jgi:diguanylate cyclase (GGDEF)-like protein/PAS domain S-box-containing protein
MMTPDDFGEFNESLLFDALMDSMADSIYFKDRQCHLIRVSKKMASDLGYKDPSELIGKTDIELFGEEFGQKTRTDDLKVMETGQPIIGLIEDNTTPSGDINWTSTTKLPLYNKQGKIIGLLGITREINDLKRVELDLQQMATHDVLTSLPNRYLFFDRLEQTISRAYRYHSQFALIYIDLDHFKKINDDFGHDAGDQILIQVAGLLNTNVRSSDTVARIGGDEFVILMETINKEDEPKIIAKRILADFKIGFAGPRFPVSLIASIGISLFPQHGMDAAQLMKAADLAMYQAKKQKCGYVIYSGE